MKRSEFTASHLLEDESLNLVLSPPIQRLDDGRLEFYQYFLYCFSNFNTTGVCWFKNARAAAPLATAVTLGIPGTLGVCRTAGTVLGHLKVMVDWNGPRPLANWLPLSLITEDQIAWNRSAKLSNIPCCVTERSEKAEL